MSGVVALHSVARGWSILVAVAVLAACSKTEESQAHVPQDAALIRALEGSWCVSDDGGKTCWGYDTFLADGTVQSCGIIPETKKSFSAKASFKVIGATACYEVTGSDDLTSFPVGSKFCAKVLAIDDKSQRYKHLDTGETLTTYRVPTSRVNCLGDAG